MSSDWWRRGRIIDGVRRRLARRRGSNVLLDVAAGPPDCDLIADTGLSCAVSDFSSSEYREWLRAHLPGYQDRWRDWRYKKGIELFTSYQILQLVEGHTYLDVAAGGETYAATANCRQAYAHDLTFAPSIEEHLVRGGVTVLKSDASDISLPDGSVDRISCHHAFEHFQSESDTRFVDEVARLLRPGGRAAIVPIFFGREYLEVTSSHNFQQHFDPEARRLRDASATLPGGPASGDFARIYDVPALRRRVIDPATRAGLDLSLVKILLDGVPAPDASIPVHREVARVNFPYIALVMQRRL